MASSTLKVGLASAALVGLMWAAHAAWLHHQLQGVRVTLASERQTRAQDTAAAAQARASAVEKARAEEQRRTAALREIIDEATQQNERLRADADGARTALERVRRAARTAGAGASCAAGSHPTTAQPGQAAEPAGLVLADVFSGAAEAAVDLGAALDAAHAAGQRCERAYDALNPA